MELRPYQSEIVSRTSELLRNTTKSVLITAPTGSGKTCLATEILQRAKANNFSSLFLVHRRELIHQSLATFKSAGIACGVIANNFPLEDRLIQIGSVQTLTRRLEGFRAPRLIIWDECHHIGAKSWQKIYDKFPDARHIGLTATPMRMGGVGLSEWFTHMVQGPPIQWLIDNNFLSPYRLFASASIDLKGVRSRMGDYVTSDLARAVNKSSITGCAVSNYEKRSPDKRAIVFCVSIEHSKTVCDQFKARGIRAEHVDGETPTQERDAAIARFRRGQTKVLSNVDLFGEGFDLPAVEVGILLRPTQSLGLYLQQVGRVLRTSEGKSEALIFDHAGNCAKFGLPCEDRQWSLHGKPHKSIDVNLSVTICPVCFAAQKAGASRCFECHGVFPERPREVEEVEGELIEIAKREARVKEQKLAQTLPELIALGRSRGYKRADLWAQHVMSGRKQKSRV